MRTPIIAGNWKMHNTIEESVNLVKALKSGLAGTTDVEIIVAPPYTALASVVSELKGSNIKVSAQNLFWENSGAFTGEVSPHMIKDAGCQYVIIGHSERRQYFGETDETVNKKLKAALNANLVSIVCVGETLQQRESGETTAIVTAQVKNALAGVASEDFMRLIIAYEPVWAIGTGKTATPDQAAQVHQLIRGIVGEIATQEVAQKIRILYGGSVKPENVDELMQQPDIDGALVGGASLKAESFIRIVNFSR